jgi:hypothetical protein
MYINLTAVIWSIMIALVLIHEDAVHAVFDCLSPRELTP